jgi:hypothetical protein
MQPRASVCSPQTLLRLQNIFDAAWLQLMQKKGKHSFPWSAEASRYMLAQLVLAHSRDKRHIDEIVQEVLVTMDRAPMLGFHSEHGSKRKRS